MHPEHWITYRDGACRHDHGSVARIFPISGHEEFWQADIRRTDPSKTAAAVGPIAHVDRWLTLRGFSGAVDFLRDRGLL